MLLMLRAPTNLWRQFVPNECVMAKRKDQIEYLVVVEIM